MSDDVPGARTNGLAGGLHHVGITVPDLDRAVEFFCDVLGAELKYREGPVSDPLGDWMEAQLNVHPRAELSAAMLSWETGSRVELFEYRAPDQRGDWPCNSDHGAAHLGLIVDDIDDAVARLRSAPEVRVLGEVGTEELPEVAGTRWIYFLTPWGMQMELVQPPPDREESG